MLRFFGKRLQELQEVERSERGFTLIELLVVVIIIGILAAIAIPVFISQREKAWAAAAASELRNMAAAATACSVDNDGAYDGPVANCGDVTDGGDLEDYGWSNDSEVDQTADGTVNGGEDWEGTASHTQFAACVYSFTTEQAAADTGKVVDNGAC